MKIALVYTSAKQYTRSLYLTGAIGNEIFTEFYILPAMIWGYGMDQNYARALPLLEIIKNRQAKLVAATWLAKAYIAHHRNAAKLLEDAERLALASMEQWLATPYTADNYFDFLKRADALVNLSEADFQSGRKSHAERIMNGATGFIRLASFEPGLEFFKGAALAEVALSRYHSGYRAAGVKLMAEAEKYVLESGAASANNPVFMELAETYAKMRNFDKALKIADTIHNETEDYYRFDCLEKIGAQYYLAGQKTKAAAIWQQILTEVRDDDIMAQVRWLGSVAVDFYRAGQAGKARDLLRQAWEIAAREKEGDLKDAYPEALLVIIGKYREAGERDRALQLVDQAYEAFQTLRLQNMMGTTPNHLVSANDQALPYYRVAVIGDYPRKLPRKAGFLKTIQASPAQVRADLLGINLATEYAQLGGYLRSLQVIRLLAIIENKVEGLILTGKIFYDDKMTASEPMRKVLREIAEEAGN